MGCFRIFKIMMMVFNFLISLCGAVLLAMGIWVIVDKRSLMQILGPFPKQILQYAIVGYVITGSGGVLCLLGLLGGCSANRESKCLLLSFFSVILILFIVQGGAAAVMAVYSSFAEGILEKWAITALKEDYGKDEFTTQMWNGTMHMLKCCGYHNYTDLLDSYFSTNNPDKMPLPCCTITATSCSVAEAKNVNLPGCFDHILALAMKNIKIIGGIVGAVCGLEIAAMFVAIFLFTRLDRRFT